jgi:hypothetical protein
MQPCNRIYYSKIYWRLNMIWAAYRSSSGAPNCICSLWFIYLFGDRPLSRLGGNWITSWTMASHDMGTQTRGFKYSSELLMMNCMPLETCSAFNTFRNNKFYYKVASCWLYLLLHTRMHGSMNIKFINAFSAKPLNTVIKFPVVNISDFKVKLTIALQFSYCNWN